MIVSKTLIILLFQQKNALISPLTRQQYSYVTIKSLRPNVYSESEISTQGCQTDLNERIKAIKKQLENLGLDGYLVTNVRNVYYLTDFLDISNASLCLIVPLDSDPVLLTYQLSYLAASETAKGCTVKVVDPGSLAECMIEEAVQLKLKNIHFDEMSFPTYLKMLGKGLEVKQDSDMIWNLRRIKEKVEIEYMKRAAELTDVGAQAGLEAVKAGTLEYEVAAEAEYAMRRNGSEGVAFETVVASGPRSAYPHGICADRRIHKGDIVVLDLGALFKGYRSDITRTMIVDEPSPRQREVFDLVLEAQEKAFRHIHSGVACREVDEVARNVLKKGGYVKEFLHGVGHGVGLDTHEQPTLSSRSNDFLEVGNIVTVEPGIYIKGFGGVRIEDTVLVLKEEGDRLTKTPRTLT